MGAGVKAGTLRLGLFLCAVAALLALPSVASADITFGPQGLGAGQLNNPEAIAVDNATGEVFVADTNNNRVSVFDEDGDFLRAFGWGVDTGAAKLETCTTASGCQAGIGGAAGGQFSQPVGIAVDNDPLSPAYHDIYVSEGTNARVQRFTPAGAFVLAFGDGVNQTTGGDVCTAASGNTCKAGTSGAGAGQFVPSTGNGFNVPRLAVGSGGTVHVADYTPAGARLQRFDSNGAFLSQIVPLPGSSPTPGGVATLGLAVEPDGDFYVATFETGTPLRKYDPSGALLATVGKGESLALDPSGNLYALGGNPGSVSLFDPAGTLLSVTYGEEALSFRAIGVAARSTPEGDFYVLDPLGANKVIQIKFEPPGPAVLTRAAQVDTLPAALFGFDTKATAVTNLIATLNANANPEGKATTLHFQYISDEDFKAAGDTFGAGTVTTPESASIGSDFKATPATFAVTCPSPGQPGCLTPDTVYHLRAVATSADGTDIGSVASFKTLPPIELGDSWSTDVGFEGARLHARLSPNGIATTAHFEYVDEGTYEESGFADATATTELDFGAGAAMTDRSALLGALPEGTTYRYRYLASDFYGEFEGPVRSFTTLAGTLAPRTGCPNQAFRSGAAASLPDCRAYEMVSPLEKGNGDVLPPKGGVQGVPTEQAASSGDALAYISFRAFGDAVSSPFLSQYLARRNPEAGWSTHSLNQPLAGGNLYESVYTRPIYKGFSEDLCSGWLNQNTDLALAPGAPAGVPNLYRRLNCGEDEDSYELLTTVAPPGYSREGQEGLATFESAGGLGSFYYPGVGGWSEDGTLTAFKAGAALTPEASIVGVGKKLTCELGKFSANGTSLAYQWLRNGVPIAGKTTATYETAVADKGQAIQCRVKATNEEEDEGSGGKAGAVGISNPAQVVAPAPATMPPIAPSFIPAPETDAPLSLGGPGGQTLTCDPREAQWQGSPTSFSYEWYRNGSPPSSGSGAIEKESKTVKSVLITSGADFGVGWAISAPVGIPPGTTIAAIAGSTLTLSAPATLTLPKVPLSASPTTPTFAVSAADLTRSATFQCVITATNAGGSVSIASANQTTTGPAPEPSQPHPRAFVLDVYRVYAQREGQLALVSVLPSGEAVHTHASVGTRGLGRASDGNATDSVVGAVSADGERIFFSATSKEPPKSIHDEQPVFAPSGGLEGASRLYLRLHPMAQQSAVVEAAPGEFHCTEAQKACTIAISKGVARFLGADPGASRALYLEGEDLYEVDIDKAMAYQAGAVTKVAGGVLGFMGASKDVSRAYFVSKEVCSSEANSEGEAAQAGEPNLYLYEAGQSCGAGELDFVAGLAKDDTLENDDQLSPVDIEPFQRRSRVSGDGLHAAFVSRAQPTGYDNTDVVGGVAAAEVYLYDAAEGELRCASCNPSGGRPRGGNVRTVLEPTWVAAQIPGWATQWHPSRVLSEDGNRLFFESFEGLVPRDTNGRKDVYEWQEAHSRAECEEAGAERYVASSEGCLSLISSGTSAGDSDFIDASASGSDVFFHTATSLVGVDYGLIDIYDARVNGGFPEPQGTPPGCEGEACQGTPEAPNDPTPASESFQGAGNVSEEAPVTRKPCAKGKVRRHGKCVAKKHRKAARRAKHKRRAHR